MLLRGMLKDPRYYSVRLRLSEEERYRLRVLAAQANMSITAYLTWLLRQVIKAVDKENSAIPGSTKP
jgi:hypothetical protein